MSVLVPSEVQKASTNPMPSLLPEKEDDHVTVTRQYILVFAAAAAIVAILLTVVVLLLLRKWRTRRLRHHLMPLYSFDTSDDCQEWEAELLDDLTVSCSFKQGYKSLALQSD